MSASAFVDRFGGIYEHSPWVAEGAEPWIPDDTDLQHVAERMADCVDNASRQLQLELIRAHPDLAGRAQVAGELTPESSEEQARAGLDHCSPDELERFQTLNERYKEKFGFPFIMAVRNSSRSEILETFASRLENDYDVEFETALVEIHKIARLRLATMESAT